MKAPKRKRMPAVDESGEPSSAYFFENTASTEEFTGMTPTLPLTSMNAESYLDLMGVPVTSADGGSASKRRKQKKRDVCNALPENEKSAVGAFFHVNALIGRIVTVCLP